MQGTVYYNKTALKNKEYVFRLLDVLGFTHDTCYCGKVHSIFQLCKDGSRKLPTLEEILIDWIQHEIHIKWDCNELLVDGIPKKCFHIKVIPEMTFEFCQELVGFDKSIDRLLSVKK